MKRSTKIRILGQRAPDAFLLCRAALSRQILDYTAGIIRRHRRQIGSCWRKLNPRLGKPCWSWPTCAKTRRSPRLAAGFGIGTATAWRYVTETVALLAAPVPKLRQALDRPKYAGHP